MSEYFNISSGNWYFYLIIGIFLFLLLKWIFGKFIKKRNLLITLTSIFTLVFTPIIYNYTIIAFFSVLMDEYHPDTEFQIIKWSEDIQSRHEMRKDIIESELLIGKTKTELVELLGEPNIDLKITNDTVQNWTYYLGSEGHGFGWKFHYLNLNFKNGEVDKVKHTEFID